MASVLSRVLVAALRLQRRQRPFLDARSFREAITRERQTVDPAPPRTLAKHVHITRREHGGAAAYVLAPRKGARSTRRVLYLHGGCYVFEIDPYHWRFAAALATQLDCEVTVPIYPLAPEHGVDDVLAMVTATYREMIAPAGAGPIAIMGDSAGGGMALSLALRLEDEGLPAADAVVLLSPWLDVTMTNPAIASVARRDPWLAPPGLIEAGRMYAREIDGKDPRVSPLYGDLRKVGCPVSIFIGTRDVLLPDARLLAARLREVGVSAHLHEYEGMVHNFFLVQLLPEARRAFADIEAALRQR